jgi:hypothetical protein
MSPDGPEGLNNERHEDEPRFEVTLTTSQRDAVLIALQNEINSCENELLRLSAIGLHAQQTAEDYNTLSDLTGCLESVQSLLRRQQ